MTKNALHLTNIFQCIEQVAGEDIEEGLTNCKFIYTVITEASLVRTKQEDKEWINLHIWRAILEGS